MQCRSLAQTLFGELTSLLSRYFAERLRDRALSSALGGCFPPASRAALQASLRLAYFSLRQIDISSASGMNALQSLNTSGVQAKRCSGVPCEEKAGVAVVDSRAADTHKRAKGIGRSSFNSQFSTIIRAFMQASIHVGCSARLSRNVGVCNFLPRCRSCLARTGRSIEEIARLPGSIGFA